MAGNSDLGFEAVVRDHSAMVARIVSTYERRPALIEEVTQDVFIAVLKALPAFREEASLKTYIARIANNVAINHMRKSTRSLKEVGVELAAEIPDPNANQETRTDLSLKREKLVEAVRALDLSLRQVASLHLEGFSNAEIAEALSLTPNNVGVGLHRAKTEIAHQMTKTMKEELA